MKTKRTRIDKMMVLLDLIQNKIEPFFDLVKYNYSTPNHTKIMIFYPILKLLFILLEKIFCFWSIKKLHLNHKGIR